MGFVSTNMLLFTNSSLFVTLVTFLLAQKRGSNESLRASLLCDGKKGHPVSLRDPMLQPAYPARPSLGKEASPLFYRLVLRTAPYELIMSVLQIYNPIVHVKFSIRIPRQGCFQALPWFAYQRNCSN